MATYIVKRGDTLSQIAKTYNTTVAKLVDLNDITNPDYIVVGQKLTISGSSSSSTKKKTTTTNAAKIKAFGLQANTDNTLYATWTWTRSYTENYRVVWYYATGDGVWFMGSDSTVTIKQATYSIPSNATRVKFKVKPIAKNKKVNDKERPRWTANWSAEKIYTVKNPLTAPGAPTVEVTLSAYTGKPGRLIMKASLDNVDVNAKYIEFKVVKNHKTSIKPNRKVAIKNNHVSAQWNIEAGNTYQVYCRAVNGKLTSEWSSYTNAETPPVASKGIYRLKNISKAGDENATVSINWYDVANAESYTVEYKTDKKYFDSNDSDGGSVTVDAKYSGHAEISGLTWGTEYFFRVCAVKGSEKSAWTEIKSIVVGKTPAAPTTWSSVSTTTIGGPLTLYWTHNAEDGSEQTDFELAINGGILTESAVIASGRYTHDKETNTSSYTVDTSVYTQDTELVWKVRTKGITNEFSDYSTERTVNVYVEPELTLSVIDANNRSLWVSYVHYRVENASDEYFMTDEIVEPSVGYKVDGATTTDGYQVYYYTDSDGNKVYYCNIELETISSFPFYINATVNASSQIPIGYYLAIIANEAYETVDEVGNVKMVVPGETVYSEYFDINTELMVQMSADNIDLERNASYTIACRVSMNSGLEAEQQGEFNVSWSEEGYEPNAEIAYNAETLTAEIQPYCEDEYNELLEEVTLSVYRREFDGSFTEIATGLNNTESTNVIDPHPALDFARYRIVAQSNATGHITYYDVPGIPINEKSVVIQWDEVWTDYNIYNEDSFEEQPYSSSMLKLPYNIDISDSYGVDVNLVQYVGRKRPVSYYGTQLGETSTWNVTIPKEDVETLYALRRLAIYTGDVYVREPSGSGYWAHVNVSFGQTHCEVTIPVTFNITRVEGGM